LLGKLPAADVSQIAIAMQAELKAERAEEWEEGGLHTESRFALAEGGGEFFDPSCDGFPNNRDWRRNRYFSFVLVRVRH
jgi:hypothetical protein